MTDSSQHLRFQIPSYEIACAWQPARAVAGDYYDVIELSESALGICIADVVGKGGLALGMSRERTYEQGEIELNSGDRLLLFTDGVTEAVNTERKST